jgi:hypothetical protein
MNMNMLDAHVLPRAVPEASLSFDLHRESLQQAARRRSERSYAPIASACPSR